jgi:hypothetical protein
MSLCHMPVRNGVGFMTRGLECVCEPMRQVGQSKSWRHQCVTGEIVEIVPHWLWGEGWTNIKVGGMLA